jgi:hypothetical protein
MRALLVAVGLLLQALPPAARESRGTMTWAGRVERIAPLSDRSVRVDFTSDSRARQAPLERHVIVQVPEIPVAYRAIVTPPLLPAGSLEGRAARIHVYVDERGAHVAAARRQLDLPHVLPQLGMLPACDLVVRAF